MTLTEFLLARLAEDEATAITMLQRGQLLVSDEFRVGSVDVSAHVAPQFLLADVKAKRRIVGMYYPESRSAVGPLWDVLEALAQPYADHPEFDPAWRA